MSGVVHEVFGLEDKANGEEKLLAGVGVSDRSSVENVIAGVHAVLLHETVAGVLQLLLTIIYGGRGRSAHQLAAVQVAVVEQGAQLLLLVVGEVVTALLDLTHVLAQLYGILAVGDGVHVHHLVNGGVTFSYCEHGAASGSVLWNRYWRTQS